MSDHLILILISLVLAGCSRQVPAFDGEQPADQEPIKEAGYTVQGEFLRFYQRYGGPDSLGSPLTNEIVAAGWRVQYFEKGRLEYHPENDPRYRVTVGWLGELLSRRRGPLPANLIPQTDTATHRYFPKTGHSLRGDFLRYFETHGDSVRFGLPISEPFIWEGHLVQDFQSARFIWTPLTSQPVILEDIGRIHLETLIQESSN